MVIVIPIAQEEEGREEKESVIEQQQFALSRCVLVPHIDKELMVRIRSR